VAPPEELDDVVVAREYLRTLRADPRSERDSIPKSPSNATAFGMSNSASSSSTPIAESIADVSASVWARTACR